MSNFIGPALPPNLVKESCEASGCVENDQKLSVKSEESEIGPTLPPYMLQKASEDSSSCRWERGPPKLMRKKINQISEDMDKINTSVSSQLTMKQSSAATIKTHLHCNESNRTNDSIIGPSLPPKLRTKLKRQTSKNSGSSDEESDLIGPSLPVHLQTSSDDEFSQEGSADICVIGPRLPPFLEPKSKQHRIVTDNENKNMQVIGPSLPPHLQSDREDELPTVVEDVLAEENTKTVIGPVLPSHLKLDYKASESDDEDAGDMYGPALPPGLRPKTLPLQRVDETEVNAGSDDEDLGPLPEGNLLSSKTQQQLELRARQLREAMATGENSARDLPTQRESWMLELPADRAPELGLRPRQFRMREGPETGDRSVWTDTPADRERKKKSPRSRSPDRGSLEKGAMLERDKTMQQLAEQHGSKRGTRSLMDMHEEKLQAKRKKAEEDGEVQERRPFSRDVDLQVNRFDEAQKRSILKKAQHLNDRFSSGQSKFL